MPCVQYNRPATNIDPKSELFELLTEINKIIGQEKLFIEEYRNKVRYGLFKRKTNIEKLYYLYWDIGHGEYQVMFSGTSVSEQSVLAYLLGYIAGVNKS